MRHYTCGTRKPTSGTCTVITYVPVETTGKMPYASNRALDTQKTLKALLKQ